jgi:tetratricopeptide (TPR) repeat protein
VRRARQRRWSAALLVLGASTIALLAVGPVALFGLAAAAALALMFEIVKLTLGEAAGGARAWLSTPSPPHHLLTDPKRVSEWLPFELGVRRSTLAERLSEGSAASPPYAPFEQLDPELETHLATARHDLVAVTGPAGTGKTRMVYEAVQRQFPSSPLVIPDPREPGCVDDLLGCSGFFAGESAPVVVWLDDLERYLVSGALNRRHLERGAACKPHFLFVATIRWRELDSLRAGRASEAHSFDSALVDNLAANAIVLGTDAKLVAGTPGDRLYRSLDLSDGVGAALTRADVVRERYLRPGADPIGLTFVHAVVDLRRVGLEGPFPAELVEAAARFQDARGAARTPAAVKRGWKWANDALGGQDDLRLLRQGDDDAWSVDDVLVDLDQGARRTPSRPVPNRLWALAMERASPVEKVAVGTTASVVGRKGDAASAFRQAAGSEDAEAAPLGAFMLGVLCGEEGKVVEAIAAYEEAWASDHPECAPKAMYNLAGMYSEQGETEKAIAAFERVLSSKYSELDAEASTHLSQLRRAG